MIKLTPKRYGLKSVEKKSRIRSFPEIPAGGRKSKNKQMERNDSVGAKKQYYERNKLRRVKLK